MTEPAAARSPAGSAETAGTVVLTALVTLVGVAVTLAWTGHFRAPLLFGGWALGTVVLLWLQRPFTWRPHLHRPHPATLLAAAAIVAATAVNVAAAGGHVTTDRDPGVYNAAGRWLARAGTTTVPGVAGTPFATVAGVRGDTASDYVDPDGTRTRVDLLPAPGMPALVGAAWLAGGDRAMLATPPLIAALGLGFFTALAMSLVGRWFALVALFALLASLAEAYIARDAFAEVATQALIMGALWQMTRVLRSGHLARSAVAGGAIGGASALHFPALSALAALLIAAIAELWFGEGDMLGTVRRRCYVMAAGVATVVGLLGLLALRHWNATYADLHASFIRAFWSLIGLLAVACVASVVLQRARRLPLADGRGRRVTGWLLGCLTAAAGAYALALRPSVERARAPQFMANGIAAIQRATGTAIDPTRSYAELTMRWLVDYMGVVAVVLGIAGFAWACTWAVQRPQPVLRLTLPLGIIATAIYCYQPTAFPDQPWVMRRFASECIPLLLLFACWLLRRAWTGAARAARAPVRVAVVVAAFLVVALPLAVLRPVARAATAERGDDAIRALCRGIGPDAAVLIVRERPAGSWYPQTIRSFCGVPTATWLAADPSGAQRLAAAFAKQGRRLYAVAVTSRALRSSGIPLGDTRTVIVGLPHALALTLNTPPARYRPSTIRYAYAPVAP